MATLPGSSLNALSSPRKNRGKMTQRVVSGRGALIFCSSKEMQIIWSSLLFSYLLVSVIFKLANKDFSIFFNVNVRAVRVDIYPLLEPIHDAKSFVSQSKLETNVEYEDMLSNVLSPTKSIKINPAETCASSVEGTCRGAVNIFDGDTKSRWSSKWQNNQFVTFRMDESKSIQTVT